MTATLPATLRKTARIILLDGQDRVLLVRFDIQRDGQPVSFWATPGGEVEEGETDQAAAERELREELGLTLALTGPVHNVTSQFDHRGTWVENRDLFFVGRYDGDAAFSVTGLTDTERQAMQAVAWWPVAEIDLTTETIFPEGLGRVVQALLCEK